jgi:hypothetical protein
MRRRALLQLSGSAAVCESGWIHARPLAGTGRPCLRARLVIRRQLLIALLEKFEVVSKVSGKALQLHEGRGVLVGVWWGQRAMG